MAGIYIHIPFCKQACHYCNFHFTTSRRQQAAMIAAICKELDLRQDYLQGEKIESIYLGGGTPSLLTQQELTILFETIYKIHPVVEQPEITLEANPDDLSLEYLQMLKNFTPINRLSIGIQSFIDDDLKYMNRAHNAYEARQCIENAQKTGFEQLSIDLIYGTPHLTHSQWSNHLDIIFQYQIPHLSCYALTVEEKTPLAKWIRLGQKTAVQDELAAEHFEILTQKMSQNNYIHYEISNFALEGFYSKHNANYWQGVKYLGVGPAAHSFDGYCRQWNIPNNHRYMRGIITENLDFEKETLTIYQQYNEYVMTALRTIWGVNLEAIQKKYGNSFAIHFKKHITTFMEHQLVEQNQHIFTLTPQGKFLADGIASTLFCLK